MNCILFLIQGFVSNKYTTSLPQSQFTDSSESGSLLSSEPKPSSFGKGE